MNTQTERTLNPATPADEARAGWMMQRNLQARERAESAAWAEALATGRRIIGGTFRVKLSADYSRNAETADGTPTGAELDDLGRETVEINLDAVPGRRGAHVADPRAAQRWTWDRLSAAALREAEAARRTIRPRPSREAGEDAAQSLIADILSATAGTLPTLEHWTRDRIRIAIRRDLIDAQREDRNAAIDADADADADDLPAIAAAAEIRRAQRDRDPMLDGIADAYGRRVPGTGPDADPLSTEADAIRRAAGLGDRTRDAIAADCYGLRPAEIAEATGARPDAIRQRVKRGRDDIAAATVDAEARAAILAADAATGEERRHGAAHILARLIAQPEHAIRNRPATTPPERMPARTPDADADAWTVAHGPTTAARRPIIGRARALDVLARLSRHGL